MSNYIGKFIPNSPNNPWNKAFDLIKEGSVVLDVGCSLGTFGEALITYKHCIVDGIEPDKDDAIKAAKRLRKVANNYMEEALEKGLRGEKYDHIVFLDVIEHLYNPVEALALLKDYLKPGGTVIFSIPNMAHASVRIMLLAGDFEYGETGLLDKTHLHFYTNKEIERVFNEAGFSVTNWDYTEAVYTEGTIKKEFLKIGISKPGKELVDILSRDDARIFQYVGSAQVSDVQKKVTRKVYSPNPQAAITSWYEVHDKELMSILESKDKQNQELLAEKSDYESILNDEAALIERIRLTHYLKHYLKTKVRNFKKKNT